MVELVVFGKMIKRVQHISEVQECFDNWAINQKEWNDKFHSENKFSKFGLPLPSKKCKLSISEEKGKTLCTAG